MILHSEVTPLVSFLSDTIISMTIIYYDTHGTFLSNTLNRVWDSQQIRFTKVSQRPHFSVVKQIEYYLLCKYRSCRCRCLSRRLSLSPMTLSYSSSPPFNSRSFLPNSPSNSIKSWLRHLYLTISDGKCSTDHSPSPVTYVYLRISEFRPVTFPWLLE